MSTPRLYPRLVVSDATRAMAFYATAFGATEVACYRMPDGKVAHAELAIGEASFYVKDADEFDRDPVAVGGAPVILSLYVADSDAVFTAAVGAGAQVVFPLSTQFYGERGGRIRDPFGHVWIISTVVEVLTDAEMDKRMREYEG